MLETADFLKVQS